MRARAAQAIAAAFAELPTAVEAEEPPRWPLPGPPITDVDPYPAADGSAEPAEAASDPSLGVPPASPEAEFVSIPLRRPEPGSNEWLHLHHFDSRGRRLPRGY